MPELKSASPQFLVDDLPRALEFYEGQLGFSVDFVYEGFYAAISRGNAVLHLKCAPKIEADREHRKAHEHLDAHVEVSGLRELYEEFQTRKVPILRALEARPWGRDFYVEDVDGYILGFGEPA